MFRPHEPSPGGKYIYNLILKNVTVIKSNHIHHIHTDSGKKSPKQKTNIYTIDNQKQEQWIRCRKIAP
jgi:hypothetical protein